MTKEDFFNLEEEKRKSLISKAHTFYSSGVGEEMYRTHCDSETIDFISLCIRERERKEKLCLGLTTSL